jgi:FHA domain-containing protein
MPNREMEQAPARISGQTILEQLIRNAELGRFEMGYSILLPCIFNIYLHPDDYGRLRAVQSLIKEDARRALTAKLAELNGKPSLLGKRKSRKEYKIACRDWSLEFFSDTENAVPQGDVEIHSELNETPQPGYRGTKTTLLDREPAVGAGRSEHSTGHRGATRRSAEKVFAEIRYEDDSGPQVYYVTQNEISVGRGGDDLTVDLPLYTNEEVSREHLLLRRDPLQGRFLIVDNSRNGTWVDGRRLTRGVEEPVPDRAEIGVAEVLKLQFEAKR